MKAKLKLAVLGFAVLLLIGAGQALASTAAPSGSASAYFSERASTLLSEIQSETAAMNIHAETLDTFTRNPQIHWRTHAFHLDRVKGHINNISAQIAELLRISGFVEPWQQKAIDQVTSHAAEVASSTQAAIVHLRWNQNRLFVQEYRDHLTTVADRSNDLKQAVDKYLDYSKAQDAVQRLQNELEL